MTDAPALTCREVVELISDYLEHALDAPTTASVEAHLAVCPGCQNYLAQMRRTLELLGEVTPQNLPDGTVAGLMDAFRTMRPPN